MKVRKIRDTISELKAHRDNCGLHWLTFAPYAHKLTGEQRDQMEADLQHRFLLWWNTWIGPKLETIEQEIAPHCPRHEGSERVEHPKGVPLSQWPTA